MNNLQDLRLIEAGFPCHQVGAETRRERDTGKAPPVNRLHVWWARRPLTASRAAIAASLLPASTDIDTFIKELGIEKHVVSIQGVEWTLTGKLPERVETFDSSEWIKADGVLLRALAKENEGREKTTSLLLDAARKFPKFSKHPDYHRWLEESETIPDWPLDGGEYVEVKRTPADPDWGKTKLELSKTYKFRFPLDAYGYKRAFTNDHKPLPSNFTVLDPTSGGGSIPFEAIRLGHKVIANELNPVATTILHATLEYPAKFGPDLAIDIETWGKKLISGLDDIAHLYADGQKLHLLPESAKDLPEHESEAYTRESILDYLYTRLVTCPHCEGESPLLNSMWLSKGEEQWGVGIKTNGDKIVSFEPYRIVNGKGPNGEDPDGSTVKRGTGQCVHCKQAINGDEVKAQSRGDSTYGKWKDRLYCVVAIRHQPKLNKKGEIERFKSGEKKGQIKTEKIRYFRAPNATDFAAIEAATQEMESRWDEWELEGLIPTENIIACKKSGDCLRYGMMQWYQFFTPRQLLGHLLLSEKLNSLKPDILQEYGFEKGRAIITYLQFTLDKCVDYNSVQTRWIPQRGSISGTFSRHDFSIKWTFGEMVFSGPNSGTSWGLSQVLNAYKGIAELTRQTRTAKYFPGNLRRQTLQQVRM